MHGESLEQAGDGYSPLPSTCLIKSQTEEKKLRREKYMIIT